MKKSITLAVLLFCVPSCLFASDSDLAIFNETQQKYYTEALSTGSIAQLLNEENKDTHFVLGVIFANGELKTINKSYRKSVFFFHLAAEGGIRAAYAYHNVFCSFIEKNIDEEGLGFSSFPTYCDQAISSELAKIILDEEVAGNEKIKNEKRAEEAKKEAQDRQLASEKQKADQAKQEYETCVSSATARIATCWPVMDGECSVTGCDYKLRCNMSSADRSCVRYHRYVNQWDADLYCDTKNPKNSAYEYQSVVNTICPQ